MQILIVQQEIYDVQLNLDKTWRPVSNHSNVEIKIDNTPTVMTRLVERCYSRLVAYIPLWQLEANPRYLNLSIDSFMDK